MITLSKFLCNIKQWFMFQEVLEVSVEVNPAFLVYKTYEILMDLDFCTSYILTYEKRGNKLLRDPTQ